MLDIKDTEHGEWYWLWVDGPDGRHWMLGLRRTRRPDGFLLPEDGCTPTAVGTSEEDDTLLTLRGKWTILEIHPCQPPEQP